MFNFQNILESGHTFSDHELPLKFKVRLINSVMIIIVFTSTLYGLLHYLKVAPLGDFHANVNFLFAFSNLLFILWLRKDKEAYNIIVSLMLLSALASFTSALITIPNDEFRIIWFYITVFLAFFIGGIWHGYSTAAASIFIILLSNYFFDLNLSGLAVSTSITGMIILTITVKIYTKKMIDLENSLLSLNDSLHSKVQIGVEESRKKDEFMLQQARMAQMGEMIAMIAHQWRQPLASIAAISANIQLSIALDEEIKKEALREELRSIDNRTTLLSKTIDDFRNFYNTSNQKNVFNLEHTITQAIEVLTPAINNADVTVTFGSDLTAEISSFESEIIQVLMNIIKNAIDKLKEQEGDKNISVRAYQDNRSVYVVIEDSGGGVDEKIIDKIFEPYFSTKKEKNGMGLGLYMSQLIIQEHCSGILSVHNSTQGALFTITLPR
ncbi:MAG: HAMP domain-containing sensor histidine kinase [Sulfurimonadaceae bacterium]